ncbi:MAG: hypothetical protein HKN19_03760 [Halioglobus sp.]|nr:hypothetical protein [Halioglobus sp.]
MTDVYVIRNQLGHYWGKNKSWQDGRDPHAVLRTKHEDEAVNTLFELSSKDFELRGEVLGAALSERGEPVLEPSEYPLPAEPEAGARAEVTEPAATGEQDASAEQPPDSERAAPTA